MKKIKLFGTDGVRGRANHFPMTVEIAMMLGKAVAKILRKNGDKHRVVIGKDTRLSGYMFENALVAGLNSMGIDTLMVGPFPTPGVAFITRAYRADAGIVISASHNPYHDNGIKIFTADGFKLPGEVEAEIEDMIAKVNFEDIPSDDALGRNKRIADADGRYIEFAKATFPKGKTLKGLKVFLDCANGAAHRIAPLVFWELDAKVYVDGNNPDGMNINLNCGSLNPHVIKKGVLDFKADVGIALDGDADRVIMVDEKGQLIDGDTILAICAEEMKKRGQLKNDRVVATIMTNLGVIKYLESLGIKVFQSQVGDRYVIRDMLKNKAFLGGEQSGHLIFLDHNTTGDGIVSALQVLRIMIENDKSLSELASSVKKYPQTLINVPVKEKLPLSKLAATQTAISEAEKELDGHGRVLVRFSGTEDLCRVMVEGETKQTVEKLADQVAKAVEKDIGLGR